jgi:hypothetical protein
MTYSPDIQTAWQKTREPGIRVREGAKGKAYRYAYRDSDRKLRSKESNSGRLPVLVHRSGGRGELRCDCL